MPPVKLLSFAVNEGLQSMKVCSEQQAGPAASWCIKLRWAHAITLGPQRCVRLEAQSTPSPFLGFAFKAGGLCGGGMCGMYVQHA